MSPEEDEEDQDTSESILFVWAHTPLSRTRERGRELTVRKKCFSFLLIAQLELDSRYGAKPGRLPAIGREQEQTHSGTLPPRSKRR